MLEFKEIELTDKPWVDEFLRYSDLRGSESNFTSLFIWKNIYHTRICRYKDFLLVRSGYEHPDNTESAYYMFPFGKGDVREAVEAMREDARSLGVSFNMSSVSVGQKAVLEELYPGEFRYILVRDSFDYVYNAADLITLKGRKYQPKRNHIARFKELPDWKYEAVGTHNIQECAAMNDRWCKMYGCKENLSMTQESCAVRCAIKNFEGLGLKGGLLRVEGKVVAFSLGEMTNSDTFLVHIEKAFANINGAYPVINQEFLIHQMVTPYMPGEDLTPERIGFTYVNREDDAGDEGLRKAKLQYHPAFLIEKYVVRE